MRMHLIPGGRLRVDRSFYFPDAYEGEKIELPIISVLLKHAQGNVLFDTGCHPDVAVDIEKRWGLLAGVHMEALFKPEETVPGQLPLAGVGVDDIDLVICSHFHVDHCGCNALFKKATVLCHAKELEAASSPLAGEAGYVRGEWDTGQTINTFDGQHDVFGDGKITLLPMPGHTPGMTVAHVALEKDGEFLLVSDSIALEDNLHNRFAPPFNWDAETSYASMDEMDRFRVRGATLIYGHDDAQWRRLRKGAQYYE